MPIHRLVCPRMWLPVAGLSAVLVLALSIPSAHALKIQQVGDSPTVLDELHHAGLEESEADLQEAGRRALQEWLTALPPDAPPQPTLNAFLRRKDLAAINAYLASLSALDEFLEHPLPRYVAVLPVMLETRHDPSVLEARAQILLQDKRLRDLPSRSKFQPEFQGLLRPTILASPDVQETVSTLLAKMEGHEVLQRKRTGQAIAVFLAARRTREAARAFLAALDPETVYGTVLTSESEELSFFWYYLAPVYEVLRAQGDSFEQAGQRLVSWSSRFSDFVDDRLLDEYNVLPNELEWEDWLFEQQDRLQQIVNPELAIVIAARLRAAGLEEPTAVIVLPEVAGMAAAVPADRRHVFLWEGQPLPAGISEGMVRRLGPRPADWLDEQSVVGRALSARARHWYGDGVRHLIVVRPARSRVTDGLKAELGIEVHEVVVTEDTVEEAIAQIARSAGFAPPAGEALSDATHQVRDYQRML